MFLSELFADHPANIVDNMRTLVTDVLTELAANKVPYVTMQQVIDRLQNVRSGTLVNRNLVMTVCDPNKVQVIKKIEGDRIYLSTPQPDEVAQKEEDEERQRQQIQNKAGKSAQKQVADQSQQTQQIAQQARDALI